MIKSHRRLAFGCVLAILAITFSLGISSVRQNAQERQYAGDLPDKYRLADEVTREIRDAGFSLARISIRDAKEREVAARYGRVITDHGSLIDLSLPKESPIEGSGLEVSILETTISLAGKSFDPIIDPPLGTIHEGRVAGGDAGYFIVQIGSTANDELLDSLRSTGIEIIQYVPHQAFLVYGDEAAMVKIAGHSRVRWIGAFLPEHKIHSVLNDQLSAARSNKLPPNGISPLEMTGENKSIFDIAVFKRADLERIANLVRSNYGGNVKTVIDLPGNYFNVVRAELSLDDVLRVADIPDVITIDFYSRPKIEDERAAHIIAGNYTGPTTISGPGYNPLTQFGVNGLNVTISMVDDGVSIPGNGGFYVTSANTVDGPLRGSTAGASGGHGHINASIISGDAPFGILDPTGHNYGLGVAPKSHIINIPFLKAGYSGSAADVFNDTVITNGPNGVRGTISNNSWGSGTNSNVYDSFTAQFDGYVRDASAAATIDPVSLIFSAGNCGNSPAGTACNSQNGLTRPKVAKNVIATGNSENLRTELSSSANNIEDLNSSSSRGPAIDGRVKPDIVAPGTVITGSRAGSCGSVSSCFEANHAWSTGTSHAAPQIAGAAALFTEFWKAGNGGANPSPALVKAAIISTAQEMTGVNVTAFRPNGAEGWGRVNMKYMLNTGVPMLRIDQTTVFTDTGNSATFSGTVGDGTKPLLFTLVWTDPPGAANANPALVNNLDLTVTVGPNTYRGNVFANGLSITGGSANLIDNVENVWLPAGLAAGTPVTIQINATAINGDGVLGNGDPTDQHFALVAYNFSEGGTPTPTPTNTPTATPTNTPTATPTNTPTATPTNTPTATPTNTPTATPTNTPTATPTNTPTATPTATPLPGGGFEGDVAPRPTGNGIADSTDVVQLRRFAATLDTPDPLTNERQRADCAPLSTGGDGTLNVGDVVQGRRFAAGLDPLIGAGGPTGASLVPETVSTVFDDVYAYFFGRELKVGSQTAVSGTSVTIPVEITPYGDEVAFSFTIDYDAARLSNPQVTLGDGASEGSALTVNTNDAGRIGILVDAGEALITSRMPAKIVNITFEIAPDAEGVAGVRLTGSLAAKGVADATGNLVATRFLGGAVRISKQ